MNTLILNQYIFSLLDLLSIINNTNFFYILIMISSVLGIICLSNRHIGKMIWDVTKWVSAGVAFGAGEYGAQWGLYRLTGNTGSNSSGTGNSSSDSKGTSSQGVSSTNPGGNSTNPGGSSTNHGGSSTNPGGNTSKWILILNFTINNHLFNE